MTTQRDGRNPEVFQKVYYYHLKKCAGTSLNHWFDRQVADDRICDPEWLEPLVSNFLDRENFPDDVKAVAHSLGRSVFFWTDAVYSHMPLRTWMPEGTMCTTVLRSPVDRLVSQIADWRRLSERDYAAASTRSADLIRDAGAMPLRPYLERHGRGAVLMDNYLVRALAATRRGFTMQSGTRASDLLDEAVQSLTHDFHVFGLTDYMQISLNAIAERFGRAPEEELPRLNETGSTARLADEASEAKDILAELTAADQQLYERAQRLFMERHAARGAAYNRSEFERFAAAAAVRALVGRRHGDATVYSVRDPIVGSGFHGRDAAGQPTCRMWCGPSSRSVLYIPVPAGASLALQLWVHGYGSEVQRDRLRCAVDGVPAAHRFVARDGYRDLIEIAARPSRDFAALELDVGEAVPTGSVGAPGHDARRRGMSFDRYGWRVLADAEPVF